MTEPNQDLYEVRSVMAAANPAPPEAMPPQWSGPRARADLTRILTLPGNGAAEEMGTPRYGRRTVFAIGAVAAAASVAAGFAITGLPSGGQQARATPPMLRYRLAGKDTSVTTQHLPDAGPTLRTLAMVAERQEAPGKPTGATIGYTQTRQWNLDTSVSGGTGTSTLAAGTVETWTAADGKTRIVQRLSGRSDADYTVNSPAPAASGALATTPDSLRIALLRRGTGGTPLTYWLLHSIQELHSQATSPALEAACWRLLAGQTSLKTMGTVTDRAGRIGEAISYDINLSLPTRWVLIISPTTGRLLDVEQILTTDPGKLNVAIPAVISYVLYVKQGWVTTSAATP